MSTIRVYGQVLLLRQQAKPKQTGPTGSPCTLSHNDGRCPHRSSAEKAEVVSHDRDVGLVFRTLDLNGIEDIIRVKGASFAHLGGAAYSIWSLLNIESTGPRAGPPSLQEGVELGCAAQHEPG